MNPEYHPLTEYERGMLDALLAENFEGRDQLEAQLDGATAREYDSGGFEVRTSGPAAPVMFRVPVTGRTSDADGTGVEVLLHVVSGHISEVEMYRHDGQPLLRQVEPRTLALVVVPAT